MNFFTKIFSSNKQDQIPPKTKKQKSSFLTWLCTSKPNQTDYDQREATRLQPISQQSSAKRSTISVALTNNTKIVQRLSFGMDRKDFVQQDLSSQLISIVEQRINKIGDLIEQNGLYAMINSQQTLVEFDDQIGIWLKIGKTEEINSLPHIKPYYFDKIFIISDQFGGQYTIEQILHSKQNIYLKLYNPSSIQYIIDNYQKQLMQHFSFKLLSDCFNKLKISVIKTSKNHVWLRFNEETQPDVYVDDILRQMGFDQTHEEYYKLKEEIPNRLTLQEYMGILEHKQKLLSKYQGQSVGEYIKNKFVQKISSKALSPRNDSPRTAEKIQKHDGQRIQGYDEYIFSMTSNTLPRQGMQQPNNRQTIVRIQEKNSYDEEIFQFNVYKDDKQQEVKRVAISKERKKRSRSEDITVNDINYEGYSEDNDYFDKRE